ncbi:hypothetical protein ANN_27959 [Periplaneta americana]|uniref:Uncharacterized protein n=1 Tax=Periplaneta americana TaxID=6978 RepID=A0ABQ8RUJ4_PERAM|nr:hypothetical protein ANN_27959 [Periplaneta americana]
MFNLVYVLYHSLLYRVFKNTGHNFRPHIVVSLTCEHDPKLQEYCVCPQNMPQFDSEGIPNQAPETNKPMILNGPTSRNREGSDQEVTYNLASTCCLANCSKTVLNLPQHGHLVGCIVMDLIKMEPEDDPLSLLQHDNTHRIEENKASSKEGNLSHLEETGMKTECLDQSYDIKSEIKVEDITPVPISFPMMKTEVDEDLLDVDGVQQEQKVEVSSEEDEMLTENIVNNVEQCVPQECPGIDCHGEKLTRGSNSPDFPYTNDVSHKSIKCNICNENREVV